MSTAKQFVNELDVMMLEAIKEGRPFTEISAAELHKRVGGYPGKNHRMPLCCEVMRGSLALDAGDVIIEEPPSGQGARLNIRYVLPRRE